MENSIKRIKIENFRKFENIEIDFNETQLSSLVGENGTGKTSILDAISLASSNRVGNISEKDFRNKSNPILITLKYNKYFIVRHERPYGRYKKHMKVLCDSITLEIRMRERASAGQLFNSPFTFKKTANPIEYSDKSTEIKIRKLPWNIKRSNPNIPKQCLLEGEVYKAILDGEEDEPESLEPLYHLTINTYSNTKYLPYVFYFKRNREKDLKKGMGSLYQKVVEELNWKARNKISENNTLKDKIVEIENEVKTSINSFLRSKILNPLKQDLVQISSEFGSLDVNVLDIDGFFNSSTLSVVSSHGGEESIPVSSLGSGFYS
jgi:predicted ATP-dependent endonuclease of OLD family